MLFTCMDCDKYWLLEWEFSVDPSEVSVLAYEIFRVLELKVLHVNYGLIQDFWVDNSWIYCPLQHSKSVQSVCDYA